MKQLKKAHKAIVKYAVPEGFNFTKRSLKLLESLRLKIERIEDAMDRLREAEEAPLETTIAEWVRVNKDSVPIRGETS